MKEKEKALDKVPITLRLDSGIHEALKEISKYEMRSLNTQIEYFLRECILRFTDENKNFTTDLDILGLIYGDSAE